MCFLAGHASTVEKSLRHDAQISNVQMSSFLPFKLNKIHQWKLSASQPHADGLKPNLSMHIVALEFTDETGQQLQTDSYHCLVMSNIMMTPLQFLYTSRNSASRATSSDYNTHIYLN